MESIICQKSALPRELYGTLGLRDAYLHIPIHPPYQRFLRLTVKIHNFQFRALPFGLSSAPPIFTKVLGEALALLRLKLIMIIPYLDDMLLVANSDLQIAQEFLQSLGWLINKGCHFTCAKAYRGLFQYLKGSQWMQAPLAGEHF